MDQVKMVLVNDLPEHAIGCRISFAQRTAVKRNIMPDDSVFYHPFDIGDRPLRIGILHVAEIAGNMDLAAQNILYEQDIFLIEPLNKGYDAGNNEHLFHTITP